MKFRIIKHISVKSTNDEAIKLIKKKNLKSGIIIAKKQTKGRGTMGKKWISQEGNLFFSIFFDITSIPIKSGKISVLNAYIIRNVLKRYSKLRISIKWPNDLLINKHKLCGILQEVISYKKSFFLIIGVGINTKLNPKDIKIRSTSLMKYSNKKIDNQKILIQIKKLYEEFIIKSKKKNFSEMKKIFNRN